MPLRLLIDECAQDPRLIARLRGAGHDVLSVAEAGLNGSTDQIVVQRATAEERVVITRDPRDFMKLHREDSGHCGILVVFGTNVLAKAVTIERIIAALEKIESAGIPIAGKLLAINDWT